LNRTLCRVQIVTAPPPDRRLVAAAVRHKSKSSLWLFRILGAVLALVALLDLLLAAVDAEQGGIGIVLGLSAAFAVPALLVRWSVSRCWPLLNDQGAYTISDWGIERTGTLTRLGYAWATLSGIDQLSGQLVFSVRRAGILPMSTAALAPGELEQTMAKAAEHGIRIRVRH
jgi:hypothetical protein